MSRFESRKVKVLGISVDSVESHREFISKHSLDGITLLSDTDGSVAKLYDAYHRLFGVAGRVYFLIDSDRRIIYQKKQRIFPLKDQTETLMKQIDEHIQ
ncbi:MAG: redoxin domain-containing protein [Deltaproteobacteria bacterium]|nr:redoxin domain-containing protein [Deltaproteobacteria bacterium]